jgi:hypothetical protein
VEEGEEVGIGSKVCFGNRKPVRLHYSKKV